MKIVQFENTMNINGIHVIDAESFTTHNKQTLYHLDSLFKESNKIIIGDKVLELRDFNIGNTLSIYDENYTKGRVKFTDVVQIPVLSENSRVWMSHTPMEVITCQGGIDIAKGHVLMGGLGIGYQANCILNKNEVTKLTIYELDEDLINTIGKSLVDVFGDKVEFINESIYEAKEIYDTYVIDIYPSYTDFLDDDLLLKTFPDFLGDREKYWAWGDLTLEGISNYTANNLLGTGDSLDEYEQHVELRDYNIDKFYELVDEQIFMCDECGYWCDRCDEDEESVCFECTFEY